MISTCKLTIKSAVIQAEFTQYSRRQAISKAKIIIPIFLGVGVLALIVSRIMSSDPAKEDSKNEMMRMSLLYGPPSLLSSLVVYLSTKKFALIELLAPVMFLCVSVMLGLILATDLTGETTSQDRQNFNFLITFIVWPFALFLGATWRYGIIVRALFFVPTFYIHD